MRVRYRVHDPRDVDELEAAVSVIEGSLHIVCSASMPDVPAGGIGAHTIGVCTSKPVGQPAAQYVASVALAPARSGELVRAGVRSRVECSG